MKNLRKLRKSKGISQAALAKRIKSTQANVSQLENGLIKTPRETTVTRLCRVFKCDARALG
jgi:transcriptional regulator with XRE-family HTH domain